MAPPVDPSIVHVDVSHALSLSDSQITCESQLVSGGGIEILHTP